MKYLLDTHILIWSIINPDNLNKKINNILIDNNNIIYVSAVSLWEISIKYSKGNLTLNNLRPDEIIFYCQEMGFALIDLNPKEASTFYNLPNIYHKDPFDRILIWQAIKNNFTFISDDDNVKSYQTEGLKLIW